MNAQAYYPGQGTNPSPHQMNAAMQHGAYQYAQPPMQSSGYNAGSPVMRNGYNYGPVGSYNAPPAGPYPAPPAGSYNARRWPGNSGNAAVPYQTVPTRSRLPNGLKAPAPPSQQNYYHDPYRMQGAPPAAYGSYSYGPPRPVYHPQAYGYPAPPAMGYPPRPSSRGNPNRMNQSASRPRLEISTTAANPTQPPKQNNHGPLQELPPNRNNREIRAKESSPTDSNAASNPKSKKTSPPAQPIITDLSVFKMETPPKPNVSIDELTRRAKASKSSDDLLALAEALSAQASSISASKPKEARKINHEALKITKKLVGRKGKSVHPASMFFLANAYGSGLLGLEISHRKAYELYERAAKHNHGPSAYRAGVSCEVGVGTLCSISKAVEYYRRGAKSRDTLAMYKYATVLLQGKLGQIKDPVEGIEWLQRAADTATTSCPHPLHELALFYEAKDPIHTIPTIKPDPNLAFQYYYKAALLNYAPSQQRIGEAFEKEQLNRPINARESIMWYARAAFNGDESAMLNISGWYLTGAEGVLAQSDNLAFEWAQRASQTGYAKAERALAKFYEFGIGTTINLQKAKDFLQLAESHENPSNDLLPVR